MSLTRRSFLGLLAAGTAIAVAPELAALLAPKRTIFLPPVGGWIKPYEFNKIRGNRLMTLDELVREMAARMTAAIDADILAMAAYAPDRDFISGSQWADRGLTN